MMPMDSLTVSLALYKKIYEYLTKGKKKPIKQSGKDSGETIEYQKELARLAQEVSIARRIDTAEDVEIEEFYDIKGEGNLGAKVSPDNLGATLGLGGSGQKVTRRIIRFKGYREGGLESFDKLVENSKEKFEEKEE